MMRRSSVRLAAIALGVGLLVVLPASASAKPKAKTKVTQVATQFPLGPTAPNDEADSSTACPSGTTLLSGGALTNTPFPAGPPSLDADIYKSGPSGNSWTVRYDNDAPIILLPSAQAICLKNRLKVTGADGKPKAVTKVTQVDTPFTLPPDTPATNSGHGELDVACPSGTTIAGGGGSFPTTALDVNIQLEDSSPQGNGWHVRFDNDEPVAQTAIASALCLKSKLKIKKGDLGKDKARSKIEQVDQAVVVPASATNAGRARFTVACPEGTTIVGGGGRLTNPPAPGIPIQLEESGAVDNAWQVTLDNDAISAQTATIHALCLKNKLKVK